MSYTAQETREHNAIIAMELMRHKALINIAKRKYEILSEQDVNECLLVAGLPLIVPGEVEAPEVKVININNEEEADDYGDTV